MVGVFHNSDRADFNTDIYYRNKLEFSQEVGVLPFNIPCPFDAFVDVEYTQSTWVSGYRHSRTGRDNAPFIRSITHAPDQTYIRLQHLQCHFDLATPSRSGLSPGSKRFSWDFAGRRPCSTYMDVGNSEVGPAMTTIELCKVPLLPTSDLSATCLALSGEWLLSPASSAR